MRGIGDRARVEVEQAFARGMTAEQITERLRLPYRAVVAVWTAMQLLADDEHGTV